MNELLFIVVLKLLDLRSYLHPHRFLLLWAIDLLPLDERVSHVQLSIRLNHLSLDLDLPLYQLTFLIEINQN